MQGVFVSLHDPESPFLWLQAHEVRDLPKRGAKGQPQVKVGYDRNDLSAWNLTKAYVEQNISNEPHEAKRRFEMQQQQQDQDWFYQDQDGDLPVDSHDAQGRGYGYGDDRLVSPARSTRPSPGGRGGATPGGRGGGGRDMNAYSMQEDDPDTAQRL